MQSLKLEKGLIYASIVAALPLFHLDKSVLGWRRFAWLAAVGIDGYHQFLVSQNGNVVDLRFIDEFIEDGSIKPSKFDFGGIASTDVLHRLTFACASFVMIPHLVNMLQEMGYLLAFATLPPMGTAFYLALDTPPYSVEYWKVQAFLHVTLVAIAYLNHLNGPSPTFKPESASGQENGDGKDGTETKSDTDEVKKKRKKMKKV